MLSLPSLSPQDSSTLWYSSRDSPNPHPISDPDDQIPPRPQQRRNRSGQYRSPLTQLRFDEESIRHRKRNITDYGAAWLRPPGLPKSLHQLREDEREMKEHQEALRREQLAQELAEMEAGGVDHELLPSEEMMAEMEEMPDLDAEIPEADLSHADSDSDLVEVDDEDDPASDDTTSDFATRTHVPIPEDLYRPETLVYGRLLRDSHDVAEEGLPGMLLEEDLLQEPTDADAHDAISGIDQDMDLDDAVPEAEAYEHTDTEEEISSSDLDSESVSPSVSLALSNGKDDRLGFRVSWPGLHAGSSSA